MAESFITVHMDNEVQKAFDSLRERVSKLEIIMESRIKDLDWHDKEISHINERLEPIEWMLQDGADVPIEIDDHFIKLTSYNHEPLYVKMDCITRMRWIDDIDPYTRIYSAGGDFSVRETPEQIMESLGYRKEQNDA